jgi:hypothetical protein
VLILLTGLYKVLQAEVIDALGRQNHWKFHIEYSKVMFATDNRVHAKFGTSSTRVQDALNLLFSDVLGGGPKNSFS